MELVSLKDIKSAQARIAAHVPSTPVLPSIFLAQVSGLHVYLKLENLNTSGSFKIRGAANALLQESAENLQRGVAAASAGNHAQGVAYVANMLKCRATIFMPERTPLIKVEATRMMGADVVCVGKHFDDAYAAAKEFVENENALFIHPYADARVIAGQGTVGIELFHQVPDLDAVVVPIGGGGLIAGVACALKSLNPKIKVYGVQSTEFSAIFSRYKGKPYQMGAQAQTIADGIAVKSVADVNYNLIQSYVDDIFTVDDEEIAAAIMSLAERNHLLVEGAGGASVAAFLQQKEVLKQLGHKKIACVLSGGNIDINLLTKIADRGLIASGRLSRLKFNLMDKPGALAALLNIIGSAGANVNEVYHNRLFSSTHYHDVEVEAVVETTNHMHRNELFATLRNKNIDFVVLN